MGAHRGDRRTRSRLRLRSRRLHVTVGDSNMSETTTLLKVGATDLVLRMVEAGTVMRDLTLENPIRPSARSVTT